MCSIVAKSTGAGWSSHGAMGSGQFNVKNPNILVVALELNIVMTVGSNLHAFTMVLLAPVITVAKLTLTHRYSRCLGSRYLNSKLQIYYVLALMVS